LLPGDPADTAGYEYLGATDYEFDPEEETEQQRRSKE
jgi:hypothetical protein